MSKVKIKQIRGLIKCSETQRRTIQALGLRKINHEVEHEATPQILGMISKVNHLVTVAESK
jgi:large subunit ribosomal protein L30